MTWTLRPGEYVKNTKNTWKTDKISLLYLKLFTNTPIKKLTISILSFLNLRSLSPQDKWRNVSDRDCQDHPAITLFSLFHYWFISHISFSFLPPFTQQVQRKGKKKHNSYAFARYTYTWNIIHSATCTNRLTWFTVICLAKLIIQNWSSQVKNKENRRQKFSTAVATPDWIKD